MASGAALFFLAWELSRPNSAGCRNPSSPRRRPCWRYTDDWEKLVSACCIRCACSRSATVRCVAGFGVGVAIGWYKVAAYWIHPVLRFIGPLPGGRLAATSLFRLPSSWSASLFLIALATGFPVAILTWSGIAAVPSSYYDVARTLGAGERFLILKVAVPAAMPSVFVGLFSWAWVRPSPCSSSPR